MIVIKNIIGKIDNLLHRNNKKYENGNQTEIITRDIVRYNNFCLLEFISLPFLMTIMIFCFTNVLSQFVFMLWNVRETVFKCKHT